MWSSFKTGKKKKKNEKYHKISGSRRGGLTHPPSSGSCKEHDQWTHRAPKSFQDIRKDQNRGMSF
jgi:hypothetical protein